MGIESSSPKLAALRVAVEKFFGKIPKVHNDFILLADSIEITLHQHISETTLERIWNYSNRGYATVSLHTLNIISRYIGKKDWQHFCDSLAESGLIDSDMFEGDTIKSEDLKTGDKLQIGWLPDRLCVVEYLGNHRFIAIECENSTIQPGDTFHCLEFILHQPLNMDYFQKKGEKGNSSLRYVAGKMNGITTLRKL